MAASTRKDELANTVAGMAGRTCFFVAIGSAIVLMAIIIFERMGNDVAAVALFLFGGSVFGLGWFLAQKQSQKKVTTLTQSRRRKSRDK